MRRQWNQEVPSYSMRRIQPDAGCAHTCPRQAGTGALRVVERGSIPKTITVCVFMQRCPGRTCPPGRVNGHSRNIGPTGQQNKNWLTAALYLCQCGLTCSKPNGGLKTTSRGAVWTASLGLSEFTKTRHKFMQGATQRGTPQTRKRPRPASQQKGVEAKGHPSHWPGDSEPKCLHH